MWYLPIYLGTLCVVYIVVFRSIPSRPLYCVYTDRQCIIYLYTPSLLLIHIYNILTLYYRSIDNTVTQVIAHRLEIIDCY